MTELILTSKRIVMRYEKGTYTFSRVKPDAADQNLFNLANTLTSLQVEQPKKILQVVTKILA